MKELKVVFCPFDGASMERIRLGSKLHICHQCKSVYKVSNGPLDGVVVKEVTG